jgi:DNA-binding MarR family transcriptional regulator
VDEIELSEQLLDCVMRIRKVMDDRLREHGLSIARKRALATLAQSPARQSDLATAFEVTPRTITELVDGLARDGFVERREDPADRRVRVVHITAAGRRANDQAVSARDQVATQIFGELSEEDRDTLSRMLTTMKETVGAMSTTDSGTRISLDPFVAGEDRR